MPEIDCRPKSRWSRTCRWKSCDRTEATPVDPALPAGEETAPPTDPFDEIDFGSFFDDYLDPGYKSPASESVEKPSFETFLSAPFTLGDHLRSQLSVSLLSDDVRDAAETIIGNLDEDGYLTASLDEIAAMGEHTQEQIEAALKVVHSLEPAGVGARDLRECLLLQLESRNARGRRSLADRVQPPAAARNAAVPRAGEGVGPAARTHRYRGQGDQAAESAARPALFRSGRARRSSRMSTSSRTATITSFR